MSWKNPPRNFGLKCLKDADTLTKKITGDMLTTVVASSPVDTGAFRGNWRVGIGTVDTTADLNSRGAVAVGLPKIAQGGGLGKVVFISDINLSSLGFSSTLVQLSVTLDKMIDIA